MSDRIRRVRRQGVGSRLVNSVVGMLIGLLLIVVGVAGLAWNENRSVVTARSLTEGAGAVTSVSAMERGQVADGALIHLQGTAESGQELLDDATGLGGVGLRLDRTVEMYQWREEQRSETRELTGGTSETVTIYEYRRVWSETLIDSRNFQSPHDHRNPGAFPLESVRRFADPITVGVFTVPRELAEDISNGSTVAPTDTAIRKLSRRLSRSVVPDGSWLFSGANPSSPAIGDVRVQVTLTPEQPISMIGAQAGNTLSRYQTVAGNRLLMLSEGLVSAEEMFDRAQRDNIVLTWVVRLGGILALAIGFMLTMRPIRVVASIIPPLGRLVGAAGGIIAFTLALVVGLATIATAWLFVRPLIGGGLLVIAVGCLILPRLAALRGDETNDGVTTSAARGEETPPPPPPSGGPPPLPPR